MERRADFSDFEQVGRQQTAVSVLQPADLLFPTHRNHIMKKKEKITQVCVGVGKALLVSEFRGQNGQKGNCI